MADEKWTYAELIDRNWGFLNPRDQDKIRQTRILIAGCGLGSNIAALAARTGFTRFIVADGDAVEVNNLNRQAFRLSQVGLNKAEATAQLICSINPESEIKIVRQNITENDVSAIVNDSDLIVNTVDPGPVLFALNQQACAQNKFIFFPINIGFGGMVLVFSRDSATLEEMVGEKSIKPDLFLKVIAQTVPYLPHIGHYIEKFAETQEEIFRGNKPGPQMGIAASINAALAVTAMVRATLGLPLKKAPEPLSLDAWVGSEKSRGGP